ncbi:MAG: hypothetical protein HY033_11105 [Ignavibacteriae bacterium]|nr:hypothetical protein [Ignavibacteria bacterium]MBI3365446.1 hypothetical protein [Ignavibacteriota bacterium]
MANKRFFTTGSAGFLIYEISGNLIAEITNRLTFDQQGPSLMNGKPQTSVQVVTINNLSNQKSRYYPPTLHYIPDAYGTLEIHNSDNTPFVSCVFRNPWLE